MNRLLQTSTVLLLSCCLAACTKNVKSIACEIDGPRELAPDSVKKLRLGMSLAEVEVQLGEGYSPTRGLYLFSTGGNCPLPAADSEASCGVIADFRIYQQGRDPLLTEKLQSCSWAAIGE